MSMKKLLALVALVLGVVSCQTESDGIDVSLGGEVDALVNVTIPETRSNSALGAFDNVDFTLYSVRYILDVYYGVIVAVSVFAAVMIVEFFLRLRARKKTIPS